MTLDELDSVLRAIHRLRPFRPFTIEFVSGDRIVISRPETVMRQTDIYTFLEPTRQLRLFTAASVCQVLVPTPTPSGNTAQCRADLPGIE